MSGLGGVTMQKVTLDKDSMDVVLEMGSSRTRFFKWLLDRMDSNNVVRGTVREMAEACRMSQATVTVVLQTLISSGIVVRLEDPHTYWMAGVLVRDHSRP